MAKISISRAKASQHDYAEAVPVDYDDDDSDAGMMHVSVRTIVHIPIKQSDGKGSTFGEIVDQNLIEMAKRGDQVEGFEIEIKPLAWDQFRRNVVSGDF